jgi:hypothetical protein
MNLINISYFIKIKILGIVYVELGQNNRNASGLKTI